MGDLSGKAALVTGAARGIGAATAQRLARDGARVAVLDLREDMTTETVEAIRTAGGHAIGVAADVSNAEQVQAAVDQVVAEFGRLDILVNNASIDALHPTGNLVHYDASKGGVVMVTKALALEFGPHNITVNAIAPGVIQTAGASAVGAPSDEVSRALTARIPLHRMGIPDDIAKVVLFLASGASDYMTGSLACGGWWVPADIGTTAIIISKILSRGHSIT